MSIELTPRNTGSPDEGAESLVMSDEQWSAMTAVANHFGEDCSTWQKQNGTLFYTPSQLRSIAARISQIEKSVPHLLEQAAKGGAILERGSSSPLTPKP